MHSIENMESKMLHLPLRALKKVGLYPKDNSWMAKIITAIAFIVTVTVAITSIMEMCVVEWDIISVAPEVEALMASFQGLIRWITLVIFKKEIAELVSESKTFWRVDDEDPFDETEAKSILQWLWKGMKFYLVCICGVGIVAGFATIIFTWGKVLPVATWFPRDAHYGYEIFYCIQAIYIITTLGMMVGADGLFVVFCGLLIAQFRFLSRRLENSTNIENHTDYIMNLQESVRYHVKLLAFGKKVGKVFSFLFLGQYLITVSVSCVELFLVSEKMDDLNQIAAFVAYMSTLIAEMAILCFLSEAVMDEAMNVGWAIYSSEWYSRDIKKVGIYVYMISTRAAKPIEFTGCGIFIINRILWFNIFKFAVSLFTLLTSLK